MRETLKAAAPGVVAAMGMVMLMAGCQPAQTADWRQALTEQLPLMGHRNWIVVADSAYPLHSSGGIETIATGEDQIAVVKAVLAAIDACKHVRPVIYADAELKFVPEKNAPGIDAYRKALGALLGKRAVQSIPHEEVIGKLDEAGETFNILILKTTLTLPYTSVFINLDCGYWGAEAQKELTEAIEKAEGAK